MNIGMILLGVFLILVGLTGLGVPIPAIVTSVDALVAGILILVGK